MSLTTGQTTRIYPNSLLLWTGVDDGTPVAEAPEPGGYILENLPCVPESARTVTWYVNLEDAKAALAKLKTGGYESLSDDGMHLSMTVPGCHSSTAEIKAVPPGEFAGRADMEIGRKCEEQRIKEEEAEREEEHMRVYDDEE